MLALISQDSGSNEAQSWEIASMGPGFVFYFVSFFVVNPANDKQINLLAMPKKMLKISSLQQSADAQEHIIME